MVDKIVVQLIACLSFSLIVMAIVLAIIPGQYSKTSQTRFSVTMTSYSRAICGCKNCRWWCISRARFESSFFADLSTTWRLSGFAVGATNV